MTIEEISKEIEGYLNENPKGLTYTFRNAGNKDEATDVNELSFDVRHHNRSWPFVLEHTVNQEGSHLDIHKGHVFRLKLKPWSDTNQPIQTIKNWMSDDIANAEDGLNSKKSSLKRK